MNQFKIESLWLFQLHNILRSKDAQAKRRPELAILKKILKKLI